MSFEATGATGTFACGGCQTRVPSMWVDFDILGYAVCPECGRTESPWIARRSDALDAGE